jgi:amino acid transporter
MHASRQRRISLSSQSIPRSWLELYDERILQKSILGTAKARRTVPMDHVQVKKTAQPPKGKSLLDILFGRPLASEEESRQRVGPLAGVPIFGLDALSSAAYGPEAALTVLIPMGLAGLDHIVPISLTIIVLLSIVYFSYRQTIVAYPGGGGSYTVASENLGANAGLLAGAALMVDYILNVAVGISAGVGAVVSALPSLQPHTLGLCLGILLFLTIMNLRGVREVGVVFMLPTYLFTACLVGVIVTGVYEAVIHGGHPVAAVPPPALKPAIEGVSLWLLLKAFASGCTAMTGVEAVSNGVQAFREPRTKSAQTTLSIIIGILIVLLAGIAYLVRVYHIAATAPGQPGYESVLSQLTAAVEGKGILYFVTIASILTVLALSANTSFADFPRLCRVIAEKGYLPYPFSLRGRRLTFSYGVYALAFCAGMLLIAFKGVTDKLIPLFAVGAFMAFTLSQAGMVMHWRRSRGHRFRSSMFVNGLGALATGITVCVIIVAKFTEGAWITVLVIPALIMLMLGVRRQYATILRETAYDKPADLRRITPPIVVVPTQRWSRVTEKALRFAYTLSEEVRVVHIAPETEKGDEVTDELLSVWSEYVEAPAKKAGLKPPECVVLRSPYRLVMTPILDYVLELEDQYPDRQVAVIVPELIERRWINYLLHNQRSTALKLILYVRGNRRIIVINVPWYLQA